MKYSFHKKVMTVLLCSSSVFCMNDLEVNTPKKIMVDLKTKITAASDLPMVISCLKEIEKLKKNDEAHAILMLCIEEKTDIHGYWWLNNYHEVAEVMKCPSQFGMFIAKHRIEETDFPRFFSLFKSHIH